MKEKEPWKFPDGSQLSRSALEAAGISPTDTRRIMLQLYQNRTSDIVTDPSFKASSLLRDSEVDKDNTKEQQKTREEADRQQERQREAEQRMAEERQGEKTYQQMTWDEKKKADEEYAEKRAMDERANANILGGMGGLASWGLGLGLTGAGIGAVSQMASPTLSVLGGPLMVSSNNRGGLLSGLRNAIGIDQKPDQDIIVNGPNQTATFTPGEPEPTPEMGPASPTPNMAMSRKPAIGPSAPAPSGMA